MLRPGEPVRRTNAELYPVISVPDESIRFGTLTSCSLGPTPSSLALITDPTRGRSRKLLQSSERTSRHSDP